MAKKTKMRQFRLKSGDTETVAWLEDDSRLHVGTTITLKTSDDPEKLWVIIARSKPHDRVDVKRGWEAGGLSSAERLV